ncbi:hypothetical protein EGW08_015127 [Elysia chlorotica]|uniref:Complex I assembly factor TIMMDC1, mitochondrial n=1 Tax=Elysia chlorotica TaxID=188477 RepID=A0A3S1B694_ELYCH|nr:hypothetical protein EGW08_015127 [Elysia chlorotica]
MAEPTDLPTPKRKLSSELLMNNGYSTMVFPFQLCKVSQRIKRCLSSSEVSSWLMKSFTVHAASDKDVPSSTSSTQEQSNAEKSVPMFSPETEILARAYIEQESGEERVRMIFKKDHMGKSSPELEYIQVVLAQTFVISFFMKYVPEFYFAKQDFIREHHGTVFRTRLEAARRMQDHVSLRAASAGGKFAVKITAFASGFAFISQMIASYRNKTSVLEYTVAAGLTGGLARIQLGVKGFIAGSALGSVLGSIVGCVACAIFKAHDATQEQRHLQIIMSQMDVLKSIEGENSFKKRLEEVKKSQLTQSLPAS